MRIIAMGISIAAWIVAAPVATAQQRWIVDDKPILDVRGVNDAGAIVFGSANWATRLPNGTVVIADASGPAVHFIDAAGKLIKSVGRSGQGPGDFRTVTWVGHCAADSVFAWDFAQMRVTTYDVAGNLGRTFAFGTRGGANTSTSCNPRGMLFAFAAPHRLPPRTPPDPNAKYVIVGAAATPVVVAVGGDTIIKLGEVPYGEMLSGMVNGRAGGLQRPLGGTTAYALGVDRLYIGITDSSSVAIYGLDGKRTGTIPVPMADRSPTAEQYAAAAEIPLAIVPAPMRDAYRAFVLSAPPPSRLPPFSKLFVDAANLLWVQVSSPGEKSTRFRVFGADGKAAAQVEIGANVEVFEIGTGYLLGARTDADDEPHLTVYKLTRSGRP